MHCITEMADIDPIGNPEYTYVQTRPSDPSYLRKPQNLPGRRGERSVVVMAVESSARPFSAPADVAGLATA